MKTAVSPEEILAVVLSQVPPGKDIRNLEKQLQKIAREEKDELFGEHYSVHRGYGTSKKLSEDIAIFVLGGGLITSYRLQPHATVHQVQRLEQIAKRAESHLPKPDVAYLKSLGKKIISD